MFVTPVDIEGLPSRESKGLVWIRPLLILIFSFLSISLVNASELPLRVAIKGEPASLNPHGKKVIWDQFVAYRMFDTLTEYSKRMRTVPALAEGWTTPDPLTWIIQIRKGVTFHNGDPLTADDVIYTFDRIRSRYTAYSDLFTKIESYRALDPHRVEIKTFKPYSSFHQFNNIFIVPKAYLERVGEEAFAKHPIGSGAYRYKAGDTKHLRLERNAAYWRSPANIKDVDIIHVPRSQQLQALMDGRVDVVQDLFHKEFSSLQQKEDFHTYAGHSNLYHYLGMDVRRSKTPKVNLPENPFKNPKVRLAIAKVINIDAINAEVFDAKAYKTNQLANSAVFGFNKEIDTPDLDIAGAKALLANAGYPNGFAVTLNTPLGAREKVAHVIAEQLKAISIEVAVEPIKDKLFWKELFKENHGYSFFLAGFSVGQTVEHSLSTLFGTKDGTGRGRLNFFGYSNPEADRALSDGASAIDTDEKLRQFQKANQLIMEDRPIIPLYSTPQFYGLAERVDWKPSFSSKIRIEDVRYFPAEEGRLSKILSVFD